MAVFNLFFYTTMRKITRTTANAFYRMQSLTMSNSYVDFGVNWHMYYYLHNNLIADYNPKNEELTLSDAGWQSNTTKERLNGILDAFWLGYIYQKDWQWYYSKNWVDAKWTWSLTLKTK